MSSLSFYQKLLEQLQTGPVILATVIAGQGSVPREIGAKMLIWGDAESYGTIGGGAGEAKVIQQAFEVLKTGIPQRVQIDLSGVEDRTTEGICGGQMQVWLNRWQGPDAIATTERLMQALTGPVLSRLVIPLVAGQSPYVLTEDSPSLRNLQGQDAYIESLEPGPALLIVGAGHIGQALANFAQALDFHVAVQDDRRDFATPNRLPTAQWIVPTLDDALKVLDTFSSLYVVLVTRGYELDLAALKTLLKTHRPYAYIGMIGSRHRIQAVFQALASQGISPESLDTIHAPIGLDIGALTPAEIAISICAELIQVRRRRE
jgi:xanthine dehydrogenase accessory factor